jgi:hypothetical protein
LFLKPSVQDWTIEYASVYAAVATTGRARVANAASQRRASGGAAVLTAWHLTAAAAVHHWEGPILIRHAWAAAEAGAHLQDISFELGGRKQWKIHSREIPRETPIVWLPKTPIYLGMWGSITIAAELKMDRKAHKPELGSIEPRKRRCGLPTSW